MTSLWRTMAACAVASCAVLVLFWQVSTHLERRTLESLRRQNEEMQHRFEMQRQMLDRLSRSQRLAHIEVLGQTRASDGSVDETKLLFIELDDDGAELARQTFVVPGGVVYFDTWTVKFAHEHVAQGHPLWGRTLVLFRRVFSEEMAPADGQLIDTPGAAPAGYASSDVSRFEQRVWANFWEIATDPSAASKLGVRVAQGEAVYMAVAAGQTFDLAVDAAGGVTLTPARPASG